MVSGCHMVWNRIRWWLSGPRSDRYQVTRRGTLVCRSKPHPRRGESASPVGVICVSRQGRRAGAEARAARARAPRSEPARRAAPPGPAGDPSRACPCHLSQLAAQGMRPASSYPGGCEHGTRSASRAADRAGGRSSAQRRQSAEESAVGSRRERGAIDGWNNIAVIVGQRRVRAHHPNRVIVADSGEREPLTHFESNPPQAEASTA
jgi:hypothetical protein